jgi:phospholipase C
MAIDPTNDPIQHIVVLALENRSFDQMLGCFKEVYPELEGVDLAHLNQNLDAVGKPFVQQPTTVRQMPWAKPYLWDPRHEVEHVHTQINGDVNNPGSMSGFVLDFSRSYPGSTSEARQYIMGYYPLGFLPALHALARDFTICDHWFSSLPGPTWPNRFFALSGTSSGRVDMPDDGTHYFDISGYFHQQQKTIFDRLNEKGRNWKAYFHDVPQSWVLQRPRLPHNVARFFYAAEFFHDARGPAAEFPEFAFIEPDYLGFQQSDDHPPHDVMKGERLVADVYNAVRSNPELWHSTLIVVFFDEHGGFYDHVYPPTAQPPDEAASDYDFNQLGVRVPALLVSPWVRRGVEKTQFDHTSLLKYLIEKWGLADLGRRTAQATSIGIAITATCRDSEDTIARIEISPADLIPPDPELEDAAFGISPHHTALRAFATYLRILLWLPEAVSVEAMPRAYSSSVRIIEGLLFFVSWSIERMFPHALGSRGLAASISEPDKLHAQTVSSRDHVAYFLMRQKEQAVQVLSTILDEEGVRDDQADQMLSTLPDEERTRRDQAVRTLAEITGRKWHLYGHDYAKRWLRTLGRR